MIACSHGGELLRFFVWNIVREMFVYVYIECVCMYVCMYVKC